MYKKSLYDKAFKYFQTNLWKQFYDTDLFAVKFKDGEIGYCCVMGQLGKHICLSVYAGNEGLLVRKDWLDKLGLAAPTTLDELYDVLYAFTYNDPDGNGKNDTYGLGAFIEINNHEGGLGRIRPAAFNVEMGSWIHLPLAGDVPCNGK